MPMNLEELIISFALSELTLEECVQAFMKYGTQFVINDGHIVGLIP